MVLENQALNQHSFRRGIEETGAEPSGMTGSGTYAIAGMQQGDRGFRDILTRAIPTPANSGRSGTASTTESRS
jgi:hypothetical protein